jgi:hypothetical protein
MAITPAKKPSVYRPIGAALDLMYDKSPELILSGPAGTGKTRMMQATVAAIRQGGHEVFTFAPSAEASSMTSTQPPSPAGVTGTCSRGCLKSRLMWQGYSFTA